MDTIVEWDFMLVLGMNLRNLGEGLRKNGSFGIDGLTFQGDRRLWHCG